MTKERIKEIINDQTEHLTWLRSEEAKQVFSRGNREIHRQGSILITEKLIRLYKEKLTKS